MGSDSDLQVMSAAAEVCKQFGTSYEMFVMSAHRTPHDVVDYSQNARKRGIQVIIAGAGGAAHLPGIIAANTTLPVIGIPIMSKSLNGMDSLLSIVQMPPGVPVATVGIDGAKNAGLLAMQILGLSDDDILQKLKDFKLKIAGESRAKNNNPELTQIDLGLVLGK